MKINPILSEMLVSRARTVTFDRIDQEYYAVDTEEGYFYNLNETGYRIWELLAAPQTVSALSAQLLAEYRIDADSCLAQVLQVLTKLQDADLVDVSNVTAE